MKWIIEKVNEIFKKYRSDNLDLITAKLKFEIFETPLLDEIQLKEVYFPDLKTVAIATKLPLHQKRYLISHALGHHLLHQSNKFGYIHLREKGFLGNKTIGRMEIRRKEKEADLFASYFLIPEKKLNHILKDNSSIKSSNPIAVLTKKFQVPEELARKRLKFRKSFEKLNTNRL